MRQQLTHPFAFSAFVQLQGVHSYGFSRPMGYRSISCKGHVFTKSFLLREEVGYCSLEQAFKELSSSVTENCNFIPALNGLNRREHLHIEAETSVCIQISWFSPMLEKEIYKNFIAL